MESHKLSKRVEQLEAFLRFLSAAQTEIRFAALPVEEIVQRHCGDVEFLKLCGEKCGDGTSFLTSWEDGVRSGSKGCGFTESDLSLFYRFGEGFGASDTEGQLSHFNLYSELVGENLKIAREDKRQKSRLYQVLGVFSGLAAALLLS
jgi:stage III sporulation protein AB